MGRKSESPQVECEQGCLVLVANRQRKFSIDRKMTCDIARFVLNSMGAQGVELSIVLVSDRSITRLNRRYLSKNRPTDVLAFSQREGEDAAVNPRVLGDVVVSVESAARQAKQRGVSLYEEMNTLLVHGILHLLGYEHTLGRDDARRMRSRERSLVRAIRNRFPEQPSARLDPAPLSRSRTKRHKAV